MESSFYYFFSATPQVLGGILALFGVFVIFKIGAVKRQLLGLGSSVVDKLSDWQMKLGDIKLSTNNKTETIVDLIEKAVEREDIVGLKRTLLLIDNPDFGIICGKYEKLHEFHNNLIHKTIIGSIFTAFTILFCLTAIPFGSYINSHECLLKILFIIALAATLISLSGLIYILIKSIYEPDHSIFPQ